MMTKCGATIHESPKISMKVSFEDCLLWAPSKGLRRQLGESSLAVKPTAHKLTGETSWATGVSVKSISASRRSFTVMENGSQVFSTWMNSGHRGKMCDKRSCSHH